MSERENFRVRIHLQVEAENGGQILGIVNNFLNNSGIESVKIKLLGIAMDSQRIAVSSQLQDITPNNLSFVAREPAPQELTDLIGQVSEAARSKSPYLANADTTDKLARLFPGLTKENLYYWERKGLIHPERATRGLKTWRVYSTSEALKVAYIWKYTKHDHFTLSSAANMADQEILKLFDEQQ